MKPHSIIVKSRLLTLLFILSTISFTPVSISFAAGQNISVQGTYYSLNWSGYVVATSFISPTAEVTSVNASWTVPTVSKPPGNGYSVIFVGIGGFFDGDDTLIQVGTAQFIKGDATYYFAWYELLPEPMTPITTIDVDPGDTITASITLTDYSNKWNITIAETVDATTTDDGGSLDRYTTTVMYGSSMLSAEWIVERPSFWTPGGYYLLQLANYGSVTFTDAQTVIGSTPYSIYNAPNYDDIVMLQGARIISAVTSPVTSDSPGTFTVTYKP